MSTAVRPAFLSRHKKPPTDAKFQQIYGPDFSVIYDVPIADIHSMPTRCARLVLCMNYDPSGAKESCHMGGRCKFVHADVTNAREHRIHVNYAYRTLGDVQYPTLAAGKMLRIAAPNDTDTIDVIASELCLRTKALEAARRPLSHCAHYYFNRTCNLGEKCQFIHAVFLDNAARQHQRAPLPSQLGRTHRPHPKAAAAPSKPIPEDSLSHSVADGERSPDSASVASSRQDTLFAAELSTSSSEAIIPTGSRYRYDPYACERCRVPVV